MRTKFTAIIGVVIATAGVVASAGRTLVSHDFNTSPNGWIVAGDTGDVQPTVRHTGGKEGGYIFNVDEAAGETWYFRAPADVLKALVLAENGTLSYSLKQSDLDAGFPDDDVVIVGRPGRLSFRFDRAPGTDWTDFSIKLSASAGWRWNWNQTPTDEQFRSVLADPLRLEIRGEYRTGPDEG